MLQEYGINFSTEFWSTIFKGILKPLFSDINYNISI